MINLKNKKGEFVMKDYVMIGLFLVLIISSISFLTTDMLVNNEGIGENVDISEIEKFRDESYARQMNETSHERLCELEDAGFFKTLFITTLEIVSMIPRLVTMTLRSMGSITRLLLGGGSEILPSEILGILAMMFFVGLLWAAVYFIRRLSK